MYTWKKGVAAFLVIAACVPILVSAQTATTTPEALLEQIRSLQAKILELQQQQKTLVQQRNDTLATLAKTLRQGMNGDDVKVLQALLAADDEVYPEGLITGFYGPMTSKAVMRFQKRHGFEQVGFVGPKTLKKLNEISVMYPVAFETSTSTDDNRDHDDNKKSEEKRPCHKVPPGHMIAPGWLKKHKGEQPVIPACQNLPPGIMKKLSPPATTTPPAPAPTPTPTPPTATTTPDTAAPIISGILSSQIGSTTATISWTTNEAATGKIYYTTTTPVNLSVAANLATTTLSVNHSLTLVSLSASTTYHYVLESKDATNNVATTTGFTMTQ